MMIYTTLGRPKPTEMTLKLRLDSLRDATGIKSCIIIMLKEMKIKPKSYKFTIKKIGAK